MIFPRHCFVLLLAFALAPFSTSTSARDTHGPGEKCRGSPGRPAVASKPCDPGFECVPDLSSNGFGSTCVEVFDCDGDEQFPLEELLVGQTSGFVGCGPDAECPSGTKCEEVEGGSAISSGNIACTRFTSELGERCDEGGFSENGFIRLPSPGCVQGKNLSCLRVAAIPGAPRVCVQRRGEGESCGGTLDFCNIFRKNARNLECADGTCKAVSFK